MKKRREIPALFFVCVMQGKRPFNDVSTRFIRA